MVKQNKLMKALNWLLNILIIILLIVVVYMFLARIFGNSPTNFQLISSVFGLYGMAILKLFILIYGINREVGELGVGVKGGFSRIRDDIKGVNNRLDNLSNDVQETKSLVKKK